MIKQVKKETKVQKERKNLLLDSYKEVRIAIFIRTTLFTLLIIAFSATIGYFLDQYFGTYPKILIGAVVASYPVSRFVTKKQFRKFADHKLSKLKNGRN